LDSVSQIKEQAMKLSTSLITAAALIAGISVASAQQTPSQRMDERANGTNRAVEGTPGGSMNNPSPNAPNATTGSSGSTKKMDEQSGGNSGAVERNPDGSTGGSKSNPSPR
jgi:hypothetical protein